jgi:hypothetical protein
MYVPYRRMRWHERLTFVRCCAGIPVSPRVTGLHMISELMQADSSLPPFVPDSPQSERAEHWSALVAWAVNGDWYCGPLDPLGATTFAVATRGIKCVNFITASTISQDMCNILDLASRPSETQSCGTVPTCVAHKDADGAQCGSHGVCKVDGDSILGSLVCECSAGYRGAACQIGPTCGTVLDSGGDCCSGSLVSAADGRCCPAEAQLLDENGACCSGTLDVCGVCKGTNKHVDIRGICCPGLLDGQGRCCSGSVDACGMCNGNNTCITKVRANLRTYLVL